MVTVARYAGAMPSVSVIMPVYNGAAFVAQAIDSVLAQSFGDFELLIVDDGSTDATPRVIAGYADPRIRLLTNACNLGAGQARNRAFAAARGRYVAALDGDDICRPDRLARQMAFLDAHPGVVLVGSDATILEHGREAPHGILARTTPVLLDWAMRFGNPLIWSSVMFRADAGRALSPMMRVEAEGAEDFDFLHRIRAFGEIARIDRALLVYREHTGGSSKAQAERTDARAAAVLTEVYRPVFGGEAEHRATMIIRHAARTMPLPDAAALALLGDTIARLYEHFLTTRAPAVADRRRIARWTARLWWRCAAEAGVPFARALRLAPHCAKSWHLAARALGRRMLARRD
jgi:glycosyltransferase involved in cell wall biosynthesis